MKREQATCLLGGLAFGFIAGFLLAYVWMAPTSISVAPAAPPAPQMSEAPSSGTQDTDSASGDPHLDVMARVTELKNHLEHKPDDAEALVELGEIYLRAAKAEQALAYLRKAQEVQPGHFQGRLFLGMAMAGTGDPDGALQLMDRTAADHPDRGEPHLLRAAILLNSFGNADAALQEIERARALTPDLPGLEELRRDAERQRSQPATGDKQPG